MVKWCAVVLLLMAAAPAGAVRFVEADADMALTTANGGSWGDYDNDGNADLYVTAVWGEHRATLWRNNGDGTFTDVTLAMGLRVDPADWNDGGAAWGDYNNDGRLDLVVAGGNHSIFVYRNDGDRFTCGAGWALGFVDYGAKGIAWSDYDGDNWLDLAIAYPDTTRLYRNARDGTFVDITDQAGLADSASLSVQPLWLDANNDGLPDLLIARGDPLRTSAFQPRLYLNRGDGTFTDASAQAGFDVSAIFGATCGDYDNDGWLDLYLAGSQWRPSFLYRNDGDGTFTDLRAAAMGAEPPRSVGAAWADYDSDGFLDLAIGPAKMFPWGAPEPAPPLLYHSTGDGLFSEVAGAEGLTVARTHRAVVWADYDRDGRPDLFAAAVNQEGPTAAQPPAALYHNTGGPGDGHWLRVRALTDRDGDAADGNTAEDRDAIGARVWVNLDNDPSFPPGRTLSRVIDGGSSYLSQNEPVAQFGLGAAAAVAVRVLFPDCTVVTQSGVAADRQIAIRDVAQGVGVLEGLVVDAATGEPIPGAALECPPLAAQSQTDGGYRFPRLPAGVYEVTAAAAGYWPARAPEVEIADGETIAVDFLLSPVSPTSAALAGTVRDGVIGDPVPGATVTCGPAIATTDADGRYQLTGLAPGDEYTLSAEAAGYHSAALPGVTVAADSTTIVEVRLDPLVGAVEGTVTDADTRLPASGVTVSCMVRSAVTAADGHYHLADVPARADMDVSAESSQYLPGTVTGITVTAGGTIVVDLELAQRRGSLSGTVREAATGSPIAGAMVTCGGQSTASAADGTYELGGFLTSDDYLVTASADGYQPLTVSGVHITSGEVTALDLALSPPRGTVAGFVRSAATAEPIPGAAVGCAEVTTVADASGYYELALAPGAGYAVIATAPGYVTVEQGEVTVALNETTSLDFSLQPVSGSVRGTVSDAFTDAAVPGATVSAGGASTTTDAAGSYLLSDLLTGHYDLSVTAAGYQSVVIPGATIIGNATVVVDVALPPPSAAAVAGIVRDADTAMPISGAVVTCDRLRTLTDWRGYYQFVVTESGSYAVAASASGYWWSASQLVSLTSGQQVTQDFSLSRIAEPGCQFEDINPGVGVVGSAGAAWGDYDGDGDPDLFLSGGILYRNDGGLEFTQLSPFVGLPGISAGWVGVAGADYDNDGDLDFFTSGSGVPSRLFRNDGIRFVDVASDVWLTYEGGGSTVSWGDYDRDQRLDLAVGYGDIQLFHSDPDGTFRNVTVDTGASGRDYCAWADVDNDGWLDLITIAPFTRNPLLLHNSAGLTLEAMPSAFTPADRAVGAMAVGDYDNDGWLDVVFSSLVLYRNNGDGTFTDVTSDCGVGLPGGAGFSWADYDNDGWLDLYAGSLNGSGLLHNNGDGTFTDVASLAGLEPVASGGGPLQTAVWADIDLDGRLDLFRAASETPRLYHNTGPAGNWLRVRALTDGDGDATDSMQTDDRDAIGARVELNVDDDPTFPPGRTLVRVIGGGYGLLGQDEPIAQFGVPVGGPVAIRVIFPDGSTVVQQGVEVNRQLAVRDVSGPGDIVFTDIAFHDWAFGAIAACVGAGIVQGYWDGTYRPDLPVTRAQMAVYISRALVIPSGDAAIPDPGPPSSFADVPADHWAYKWIEYAVSRGVVQGYPGGSYRPDEVVGRGQMAVYVSRAAAGSDEAVPDDADGATFTDVTADNEWSWCYRYVEYCAANGIVQGYWDGTYRPANDVTRDQMAVYVARAFGLPM